MEEAYYLVTVNLADKGDYTYVCHSQFEPEPAMLCVVPFGHSIKVGVISDAREYTDEEYKYQLKPVVAVVTPNEYDYMLTWARGLSVNAQHQ